MSGNHQTDPNRATFETALKNSPRDSFLAYPAQAQCDANNLTRNDIPRAREAGNTK